VIIDGKMLLGKTGLGAECGHIIIQSSPEPSRLEQETAGPALALKAKAVQAREEDCEIEEEEEEMTSTSDIGTDFAFFVKKYNKKFSMPSNEKKRTCYNCDEDNHFANECPYEKRVDKPRFVKGVKPKLKPNPINERFKKNKGRAFVGAEYTSDEEGEDEPVCTGFHSKKPRENQGDNERCIDNRSTYLQRRFKDYSER
jgi:hypothetical protein